MSITAENFFFMGSALVFISILISKTGYRFGIPTLLLFLFAGMFFGSDGLGIEFNSAKDAQIVGMVAMSVILFTGGMDTRFHEIRPVLGTGLILSTLGVILTTLLTGVFIFYVSRLAGLDTQPSLIVSLLIAATMSSTDSASVFSLLRSQRLGLKHHLRPILELESGSNDPMAYMLTLALIEVAMTGSDFSILHLLQNLFMQFTIGGIMGWALAKSCIWIINRINLPNTALYPVMLLCLILITYTATDMVHGNGYLAVYVAGLIVGNHRICYRREMSTFMDGLTWLLQVVMFLVLGLLVNPKDMLAITPAAILIGIFMMLVARPLSVWLCLIPFKNVPSNAKHLISWVGLRGAVPILFATYPVVEGVENSQMIFNIVFFITLMSLSMQGTTISAMAKKLHLDCEEEKDTEFGIEIPDEIGSKLTECKVTPKMLENGNLISDLHLPSGTLIMLVKRGQNFIVPNGKLALSHGDILLTISEDKNDKNTLK